MVLLFWTVPAAGQGLEIHLNERAQGHFNSGRIILRDIERNIVLGQYLFVTGGLGRGAVPFGTYEIGPFQGTDFDPLRIGPRWLLTQLGQPEEGMAADPRYPNAPRTELEIHALRGPYTLGCIGIVGGAAVYAEFMANLRRVLAQFGRVIFTIAGNPEGKIYGSEDRSWSGREYAAVNDKRAVGRTAWKNGGKARRELGSRHQGRIADRRLSRRSHSHNSKALASRRAGHKRFASNSRGRG
jgi:hypothetical protein